MINHHNAYPQITLQSGARMKHFLTRMQSVFDGDRYCGAQLRHAPGYDAHDATGRRIGTYPEDKLGNALRHLRATAVPSTGQST